MTEPQDRFFESSRLRLHYVVWGDEAKPAVVLVHGGRDHARSWDFVAERLLDRYAVYALDLRGHGDSEWSRGSAYQLAHHVSDLDALVRELGRERLQLIGHSFGGRIVTDYACAFPERVAKIVSIEGYGRPPAEGPPVQRLRGFVEKLREREGFRPRVYPTIEACEQRMWEANKRLSPEMVRHLTKHAVRPGEDGGFVWKFDPFQNIRPAADWSHEDTLSIWQHLKTPILHIGGSESWFFEERTHVVREALSHAQMVTVENAGHWVHHDQLDYFVKLVRDFLE